MKDQAHVFVPMGRSGYQHCCVVCGNLEHDEEHTGGEDIDPPSHTELRNKRTTIVGMPAPAHMPAEPRCRCAVWPRHRLMADGHRPYCAARDWPDTTVVDDPDAVRR